MIIKSSIFIVIIAIMLVILVIIIILLIDYKEITDIIFYYTFITYSIVAFNANCIIFGILIKL